MNNNKNNNNLYLKINKNHFNELNKKHNTSKKIIKILIKY
jgi:hypothetical protein